MLLIESSHPHKLVEVDLNIISDGSRRLSSWSTLMMHDSSCLNNESLLMRACCDPAVYLFSLHYNMGVPCSQLLRSPPAESVAVDFSDAPHLRHPCLSRLHPHRVALRWLTSCRTLTDYFSFGDEGRQLDSALAVSDVAVHIHIVQIIEDYNHKHGRRRQGAHPFGRRRPERADPLRRIQPGSKLRHPRHHQGIPHFQHQPLQGHLPSR